MGLQKLSLVAILAAVAAGVCGTSAVRGNSVNLDTYTGSNWTVTRTASTDAAAISAEGTETNTQFVTKSPVLDVANQPSPPWAQLNDPSESRLSWVSYNTGDLGNAPGTTDTGNGYLGDINGTTYAYSIQFTLDGTYVGSDAFNLVGDFLTDNFTKSVTLTDTRGDLITSGVTDASGVLLDPNDLILNSTSLPVTLPQNTEFGYENSIKLALGGGFTSPDTFTLTIVMANSYPSDSGSYPGTNPGPTGFEFQGIAAGGVNGSSAVPTPQAAWMGFSLIGGIGAFSFMRKRRSMA